MSQDRVNQVNGEMPFITCPTIESAQPLVRYHGSSTQNNRSLGSKQILKSRIERNLTQNHDAFAHNLSYTQLHDLVTENFGKTNSEIYNNTILQ